MKQIKISTGKQVTLEGTMTFGMLETGKRTMDFMCCEDAAMEPVRGHFHVQVMRDGNVYMQEHKKRIRNKPIFRDDNCSLSHGRDGRWYFCFSLDGEQLPLLPQKLQKQAGTIAQKVMRELVVADGDWRPFGVEW
ncbi:MAG: hypothetical protein IJ588_03095 [Prevotella sp.]|nr:hypothetical protein [Prevotella sp.]